MHEAYYERVQDIGNRLTPITNALKRVQEVAEDLGGLMDAIIRYAESDEIRYGQTQNISRAHSNKRKNRQLVREQSPNLEARYWDCEKAMQEPCPKHSRPGRPA